MASCVKKKKQEDEEEEEASPFSQDSEEEEKCERRKPFKVEKPGALPALGRASRRRELTVRVAFTDRYKLGTCRKFIAFRT